MEIQGWTFKDEYDDTVENGVLLAELDDIVQLLSNQSSYEWALRNDELAKQFRKIKYAISDRLQQQEHNKDLLK